MVYPKWITIAGLSSILGGLLTILLTLPFAAAYHTAYSGYDPVPFWFDTLRPVLQPLLRFGNASDVYNTYGRVFDLVYLLLLPAVFALHYQYRPAASRLEKWGFWFSAVGLIASFLGVAGDYWADGKGFFLELLGLLVLSIGCTLSGIAFLRSRYLPLWCSWLLILCLPGFFGWFLLVWHIPSGPTFAVALAYLGIGFILVFRKLALLPRNPTIDI